jgi:hypothetical protein
MRFCTKTEGEHGFPYVVPTLMTLTNTFHPENPRSSIGAKVEISRFAVGEMVNIPHLFPSLCSFISVHAGRILLVSQSTSTSLEF